jgi:hypothetical protein
MKADDVPDEWFDAARTGQYKVPLGPGCEDRLLRAAIAAVALLIAKAERERCAALVDCACAHKADVLAVRSENSGDRWRACGSSPCGALEARAIRALPDA